MNVNILIYICAPISTFSSSTEMPVESSPLEGTNKEAWHAPSTADQVPHLSIRLAMCICQYTNMYVL